MRYSLYVQMLPEKCCLDKCCLDKCPHDSWNLLKMFLWIHLQSFIKIRSIRTEIFLIKTDVAWTNVASTNVTMTVGICSKCSQKPTFKVSSKSGQLQLRYCWHLVGGGVQSHFHVKPNFSLSQVWVVTKLLSTTVASWKNSTTISKQFFKPEKFKIQYLTFFCFEGELKIPIPYRVNELFVNIVATPPPCPPLPFHGFLPMLELERETVEKLKKS